jgi:uncharacterized membrane protein YfcA
MIEPLTILLLVVSGLAASILAAVTGFGGAAILLPVLAAAFGVTDAIPILTFAQLIGNGSRVAFNRKELDLRVVKWFSLGGVPLGLFGGWLFAHSPPEFLHRLLGVFLILLVVYRLLKRKFKRQAESDRSFDVRWFAPIGAVSTLLSALVGSVGPLMAPLFLAYGLTKGAYIGTDALATVVMHVSKLVAYGNSNLLSLRIAAIGLMLGAVLFIGSYIGKRIVDRVSEKTFVLVIEVTMVAAGLYFILKPTQ